MLNNYLTETIPIREGCSIFDIFLLENGVIALIINCWHDLYIELIRNNLSRSITLLENCSTRAFVYSATQIGFHIVEGQEQYFNIFDTETSKMKYRHQSINSIGSLESISYSSNLSLLFEIQNEDLPKEYHIQYYSHDQQSQQYKIISNDAYYIMFKQNVYLFFNRINLNLLYLITIEGVRTMHLTINDNKDQYQLMDGIYDQDMLILFITPQVEDHSQALFIKDDQIIKRILMNQFIQICSLETIIYYDKNIIMALITNSDNQQLAIFNKQDLSLIDSQVDYEDIIQYQANQYIIMGIPYNVMEQYEITKSTTITRPNKQQQQITDQFDKERHIVVKYRKDPYVQVFCILQSMKFPHEIIEQCIQLLNENTKQIEQS